MSFIDVVLEEDLEAVEPLWAAMIAGAPKASFSTRLKKTFSPPNGPVDAAPTPAWIQVVAFPLKEDDLVKVIMATVTDISQVKWAENVQRHVAQAAIQERKKQEEFIDITSHEMRNPLSAILQCADSIANSIDEFRALDTGHGEHMAVLENNVESAKTILSCAAHQKRVIDDVLILSRLESMMLSITPVVCDPLEVVTSTMSMFKAEAANNGITLKVSQHESYDRHGIKRVYCDHSRLKQIFINLISNAIKFTRDEPAPRITVRYGAALTPTGLGFAPVSGQVRWIPAKEKREDLTLGPDWGTEQQLYLAFSVEDTGPGIKPDEIDRLFNRFAQATAKTHVTYGGSGLGLYISRELAEKQGGEIGISSAPSKGTKFCFYIKVRRADSRALYEGSSGKIEPGDLLTPLTSPSSLHKSTKKDPFTQEKTRTLNILLVEDNLVNQKVLRKQMTHKGCVVHVANHGQEALNFLPQTKLWTGNEKSPSAAQIDAIAMDWEMPVMDGLTCSKRIRALQLEGKINKRVIIVATTANARLEQIQMALNAGIDDVIPKPFLAADLIKKMWERILLQELQGTGRDDAASRGVDELGLHPPEHF